MKNTMVREIRGEKNKSKIILEKLGCANYAGAEITRAHTVFKGAKFSRNPHSKILHNFFWPPTFMPVHYNFSPVDIQTQYLVNREGIYFR